MAGTKLFSDHAWAQFGRWLALLIGLSLILGGVFAGAFKLGPIVQIIFVCLGIQLAYVAWRG